MRSAGPWLARRRAATLLAIPFGIYLSIAYPGVMTIDSFDQLAEARSGVYSDAHPPVMAAMWRAVELVVPGPFGMLVLQGGAFLIGSFLVLRRATSPPCAAALAGALLLFPPVLAPLFVIWKDCPMAGCLLLGAAGLADGRRGATLAGLVALIVASALRYNAPAATLPLIAGLLAGPPRARLWRYARATAVWLAVTAAAIACNLALTDRPMHYWHSSLALMDIAGTLHFVDEPLADRQLHDDLAGTGLYVERDVHAALRARFTADNFMPLVAGDGRVWDLPPSNASPPPPHQRAAIERAWWRTVRAHPGAYLHARWSIYAAVIGLAYRSPKSPVVAHHFERADLLGDAGIGTCASAWQVGAGRALKWFAKKTQLFRPFLYLALAIALLVTPALPREARALAWSGLGLEASLFLLAPSTDYRYSHWMVTASCLAGLVAIAARRRPSQPITPP